MKANKAFFFAYPNGFGDVKNIDHFIDVDFTKHEGHGICFRAGVDFQDLPEATCLKLKICTTSDINLKLEFKTKVSGNCADTTYPVLNGENIINIPKMFSPIKEICIVALKCDNTNVSNSKYAVESFEIL